MTKPTQVLSAAGDFEEAIQRYAKHLGKDRIRRIVFNEIYGRSRKARSKKELMKAAKIQDSGTKSQQFQNAVEYLYRHQIIERLDNDGHTEDRSRYVYGKAEFIRANKEKIIKCADNPKAADQIPTKRNPSPSRALPLQKVTRESLKKKQKLHILYLTASPPSEGGLRVDAEIRKVQEAVRGSKFRDNISIEFRLAADLDSLINGLNDHRPQILHFSGHGDDVSLTTDKGEVDGYSTENLSFDLLTDAIEATDSVPKVVVLSSCNSWGARHKLIAKVKVVITMNDTVRDTAAVAFATKFYAAIASGQSVKSAFAQGKVAIKAVSINDIDTPELWTAPGINAMKFTLT